MAFDLGDTVALAFTVTNSAGVPTDAADVTVTITRPDGTAESPTESHPGVGSYTLDYVPAAFGRYEVDWNSTTPTTSYTDSFIVRSGTGQQLISLADIKRQLGIPSTSTTNDEELREYIEAASGIAEMLSGSTMRTTVTERHHGGLNAITLRRWPVISVTSVTENGITVPASDYSLSDGGVLYRVSGYSSFPWLCGVNNVVVTYVAGRLEVPPEITKAVAIIAQHLWETRRGPSAITGLDGIDDLSVAVETTRLYGFAVPNRAVQLLAAHPAMPGVA